MWQDKQLNSAAVNTADSGIIFGWLRSTDDLFCQFL